MDILIFWCLNIVRLKRSCVSELCKSGMTAPPKLQPSRTELSDDIPNTPEQLRPPGTSTNCIPDKSRHSPYTPKWFQTPTDSSRHHQTLTDTAKHPRIVSWSVWGCLIDVCWCLLVSVNVCWCLECVGVCGGVSGAIWVILWHVWGAQIHSEVCLKAQA